MQSLNPTVPLPATLAIWLQGPQKAQFTKRTLPELVASTRTIVGSGPWKETNSPLEMSSAIGRAVLDDQRGVAIIGADAQEVAVADAGGGLDELVADVVAEAEGVEDVLPVAAAEDERLAVLLLPAGTGAVACSTRD